MLLLPCQSACLPELDSSLSWVCALGQLTQKQIEQSERQYSGDCLPYLESLPSLVWTPLQMCDVLHRIRDDDLFFVTAKHASVRGRVGL